MIKKAKLISFFKLYSEDPERRYVYTTGIKCYSCNFKSPTWRVCAEHLYNHHQTFAQSLVIKHIGKTTTFSRDTVTVAISEWVEQEILLGKPIVS